MKAAEYMRRGRQLTNLSSGVIEDFKSINAAKRASHGLQHDIDGGSLGRGTVRKIARKIKEQLKASSRLMSYSSMIRGGRR